MKGQISQEWETVLCKLEEPQTRNHFPVNMIYLNITMTVKLNFTEGVNLKDAEFVSDVLPCV